MQKVTMEMDELHSRILKIMKYFDGICRQNNLTYYLSGGTMLGAVREKGFIPWDDDADLMLPRKDYEKFIEIMMSIDKPEYKLGSLANRSDWTFPFARLYDDSTELEYEYLNESRVGVGVDIFPLDGVPDKIEETSRYYRKIKFLWRCRFASVKKKFLPHEKYRFVKKIIQIFCRLAGANRISLRIDKLAAKRSFDDSKYIGVAVLSNYMERERFLRSDFADRIENDFEGEKFFIPTGYDNYLKSLYGDYMKRPEEALRKSHHHLTVYLKE